MALNTLFFQKIAQLLGALHPDTFSLQRLGAPPPDPRLC